MSWRPVVADRDRPRARRSPWLANMAVYWTADHDPTPSRWSRTTTAARWRGTRRWRSERRSAALGWRSTPASARPRRPAPSLHVRLPLARRARRSTRRDVPRRRHPQRARRAEVLAVPLVPARPGEYAGRASARAPGLWRDRPSAVRGAERFTERVTLDDGSAAAPDERARPLRPRREPAREPPLRRHVRRFRLLLRGQAARRPRGARPRRLPRRPPRSPTPSSAGRRRGGRRIRPRRPHGRHSSARPPSRPGCR